MKKLLPRSGRVLPVLLAAVVLVGGVEMSAVATTGHPLMLAAGNSAGAPTRLANTGDGAALKLTSKPGSPPLAVSSSTKVAHLNADQVDGFDAAALQTTTFRYRMPKVTGVSRVRVALPGLPEGNYLATYSVVAGTTADGAMLGCGFKTGGPGEGVAYGMRRAATGLSAVSGSTMVAERAAHPLELSCFTDTGSFTLDADPAASVSSVTLTRIDATRSGSATTVD